MPIRSPTPLRSNTGGTMPRSLTTNVQQHQQTSSSSSPPLLGELERELRKLINKYDLMAVTICDREGAFVSKVINQNKGDPTFQQAIGIKLNQKLINSSENIVKMDLGAPIKILLEYERFQIIKFFNNKFIIAFVASITVPTGILFSLEPDCKQIFQILKDCFDEQSSS